MKSQRMVALGILIILSILIQTTVFEVLLPNARPDLVLILVIFFAMFNGSREGAILGVIAGLLQDLLQGRFLGMNLLALAIVGGSVGWFENKLYRDNILVPLVLILVATLFHAFVLWILVQFLGLVYPWKTAVRLGLLEALYNMILVPLFYGRFMASSTRGFLKRN